MHSKIYESRKAKTTYKEKLKRRSFWNRESIHWSKNYGLQKKLAIASEVLPSWIGSDCFKLKCYLEAITSYHTMCPVQMRLSCRRQLMWACNSASHAQCHRPNHTSMASQNQVVYRAKYRVKKATYQEEKLNYWILHLKHGVIAIILSEWFTEMQHQSESCLIIDQAFFAED